MKESNIQTIFSKKIQDIVKQLNLILDHEDDNCWLGVNGRSFVFELKIAKEKSIAFDKVAEHQLKNLKEASNGFYHKISDSPIFKDMKSRFTSQKPFDCLYMNYAIGYVVICWYEERKKKECHFITPEDFENAMKTETRKSLTYEKSKEISILTYNLNAKNKK